MGRLSCFKLYHFKLKNRKHIVIKIIKVVGDRLTLIAQNTFRSCTINKQSLLDDTPSFMITARTYWTG